MRKMALLGFLMICFQMIPVGSAQEAIPEGVRVMTLNELVARRKLVLMETVPTGGYSRFKIVVQNPTAEPVEFDPYGTAFDPPSGVRTQRVGIGLPLTINNRPQNLRQSNLTSAPTNTIPPSDNGLSPLTTALGALAAGGLSLAGLLLLGASGGGSWGEDYANFLNLMNNLGQPPPSLAGGQTPPEPPGGSWPPPTGASNGDGKIWCQPPWDEGGPYWMDPGEYRNMKAQMAEGKVWDRNNGWVTGAEKSDYSAQRAAFEEANRAQSKALAEEYARNQKFIQSLDGKIQGLDIDLAVIKAQSEGFENLTDADKKLLSLADDETKSMLRGNPVEMQAYQKRVAEYIMPQSAINNTAWALGWAKTAADQGMNVLGTYTGGAGKLISIPYTIGTNIAGSLSEGVAQYNSGLAGDKSLGQIATDKLKSGAWEAGKSIVTDEAVGFVTKPLSNWIGDKGKALYDYTTGSKGLSGAFLKNAVEKTIFNNHNHIEKAAEYATAEGSKYLGGKIF